MAVKHIQFAYDAEWLERKKKLGITWRSVMEEGIRSLELQMNEEAQEEPESNEYYLNLDEGPDINKREYDVMRNNAWKTCPFEEIEIDAVFRIRNDNVVFREKGVSTFIKKGHKFEDQNSTFVAVEANVPQKTNNKK